MDFNKNNSGINQTDSNYSHQQASQLLEMQRDIIELVVLGYDPKLVLDKLCLMAEHLVPDALASIMVFNKSHSNLVVLAAPNIPEPAVKELNGLIPGPESGSCANAVFHNDSQFVSNTYTDPRWKEVRQFAKKFTIGACWSMPIRNSEKHPLGSFALSSFEERPATEFQKMILETAANVAGIILKRQEQEQEQEQQLWYLTNHDTLTNLPNRMLFNDRLEYAIEQARRRQNPLALLIIDLDNFKLVNDTLGHQTGDATLVEIGQRISACVQADQTLARMGADEFVLLIENFDQPEEIQFIADTIHQTIMAEIVIGQQHFHITASIGISIFPDDGEDPQLLQQHADTAMTEAKSLGTSHSVYYKKALSQIVEDHFRLRSDLRKSLLKNQFLLHYQPQYDARSGHLEAVEVLLRWQHPERGMIAPGEFIPIAEESGLINELGNWVIKSASQQCKLWWDHGLPKFKLGINISVKQLRCGFSMTLKKIMSQLDFPIENIDLEITESVIMEHSRDSIAELNSMKELGFGISMDDFGTGYSSLAQLKKLPITKLKIDRSFVTDIPDDQNDMIIARTIIAMGHSLGLEVVAEGVETLSQKTFLVNEGCDILQGYLLSYPLSAEDLEQKLFALN